MIHWGRSDVRVFRKGKVVSEEVGFSGKVSEKGEAP